MVQMRSNDNLKAFDEFIDDLKSFRRKDEALRFFIWCLSCIVEEEKWEVCLELTRGFVSKTLVRKRKDTTKKKRG